MQSTLILSSRYTEDSRSLWMAASKLNWNTERLINWRLPNKPLLNPIVFVETLFSPMIAEQLGITLNEVPEDWLPKLPIKFSKRIISLATAEEARELLKTKHPLFIKPPNDKSFEAKSYDILPDFIENDKTVLIQEVVGFENEYRCFCLNKKVLTLSVYCRYGKLMKSDNYRATPIEIENVRNFAESVINEVETPNAVVIDVGTIEGEFAVIELNSAWASGIYGCDPIEVLKVVQASQNIIY